jgi:hypothetical protein
MADAGTPPRLLSPRPMVHRSGLPKRAVGRTGSSWHGVPGRTMELLLGVQGRYPTPHVQPASTASAGSLPSLRFGLYPPRGSQTLEAPIGQCARRWLVGICKPPAELEPTAVRLPANELNRSDQRPSRRPPVRGWLLPKIFRHLYRVALAL